MPRIRLPPGSAIESNGSKRDPSDFESNKFQVFAQSTDCPRQRLCEKSKERGGEGSRETERERGRERGSVRKSE